MPLQEPTREFLSFLQNNPGIRSRIAAAPDRTLLYAGSFFRPIWQELESIRLSNAQVASKKLLPDILASISTPGRAYPTLLAWAKALDRQEPWKENGFVVWRALSGIFAANAAGRVSFVIGSRIDRSDKVFAATELPVLLRNHKVDPITRDMLAFYQRCLHRGKHAVDIDVGFIGG